MRLKYCFLTTSFINPWLVQLLRNSSYETYEYAVSVVVGLGLTLFLHSSEDVDFGSFGDR